MERISELLRANHGVLIRRDHREVRGALDHCLRTGSLRPTLPGIYTEPDPSWHVMVRAADAYQPGCLITGAAAALITWWPEVPISSVQVAGPYPVRCRHRGFTWEQRRVHPELVLHHEGLRVASPALAVLDLIPVLGDRAIHEGLRRRAVCLADLWRALELTPGRPHNGLRRRHLEASRDEPWSSAERDAHRLLRETELTGWKTNHKVTIKGVMYLIDIAFPAQRVAVEIDGWEYHKSQESFVKDRWRWTRMGLADWLVLPFAASVLDDAPEDFVAAVREGVESRGYCS